MRRKLILLNLLLLAAVTALGLHLRNRWMEAEAKRSAVLKQSAKPVPVPPLVPLAPVPPVNAASYIDVAQKMLFSRDRSPNVIIEAAPPKPVPPFPKAHGYVNLGEPTVLLSMTAKEPHQPYRKGDQIGEFKIASLNAQEVVFTWDGKEFPKKMSELEEVKPIEQQAQPEAPQQAASNSSTIVAPAKEGPGRAISDDVRVCEPGDPSAPGTVVDGFRKVVNNTPFGKACRWEAVK